MHNNVYLIGRLVETPKVEKSEDGKERAKICLAVKRSYKNEHLIYETDFIDCVLWSAIASHTAEYCRKGDLVGISGRLQTENDNDKKVMNVIVDKITFLASKNGRENEE